MKKPLRILLLCGLLIIILPVLKNIYLYITYKHSNVGFVRLAEKHKGIRGKWSRTFDTWEHGIDERHVIAYQFDTDSTGRFIYKHYYDKIDGKPAKLYSWRAILPFDKKDFKEYESKVLIDSGYIKYLPTEKSLWTDTLYSKYELRSDILYLDSNKKNFRYDEPPKWDLPYSHKPDFIKLLYFWEF